VQRKTRIAGESITKLRLQNLSHSKKKVKKVESERRKKEIYVCGGKVYTLPEERRERDMRLRNDTQGSRDVQTSIPEPKWKKPKTTA